MRVNLGCGDRYANGWLNVDHDGCPHRKDAVVDLRYILPWDHNSIHRAYAGHVLEHLKVHECLDVLGRLRPCMTVDGRLLVVGPDINVALEMQAAGTLDVSIESLAYGAGRWSFDVHRWECSVEAIEVMLHVTGWSHVERLVWDDVPAEWPIAERGPRWQCAVLAMK